MSLKETGRTGSDVQLTADTVFGIVTQNPESMLHSLAGMETGGDGSKAYGQKFVLSSRSAQTVSGTTTINFAAANSPFKFRVLGGQVICLSDGANRTMRGNGRSAVVVTQGDTSTLTTLHCSGMTVGETREIQLNTLGNDVVEEDGSLRVSVVSVLPALDKASTWELVVVLDCMRVI